MKIAINKTFKNKPDISQQGSISRTFKNVDISQNELADLINDGYSFCSQHKDSRKSTNFIASNVLAVDIDAGLKLEEALGNPFVKNYCSIVYTTVNHSEEFNRFRLVFETVRTIFTSKEMKSALNGLIQKFGGDPSCNDACRMFYGSENSSPLVLGNVISDDVLEQLILIGEEVSNRSDRMDVKGKSISPTISRTTINEFTVITDRDGNDLTINEIPLRTSVHCPVHIDNNPSAFVIQSKNGVKGVFCSKCNQTYFSSSNIPMYKFDYDWEDVNIEASSEIDQEEFYETENASVYRLNDRYLPFIETNTPVVLIKSPKGSGKTEWLKNVVANKKEKGLSILLIGHRRSLISSIASRLGLVSYFNPGSVDRESKIATSSSFCSPSKYFAISVDSLSTLLDPESHQYDVVIIDEVEQVISHMISDTMDKKNVRNNTYQFFKYYLNSASEVYTSDADLNYLTVNTLHKFFEDTPNKEVTLILNQYKPEKTDIYLYEDEKHLLGELEKSFQSGEKCFVCSNSKAKIDRMLKGFEGRFPDLKLMGITSENSGDPEIQEFINNIQTDILNYDGVFVSPSIGTGIDITFKGNYQGIDNVYGFFENQINTHFDIDQQLSRVRSPKNTKLWISPREFRFESNTEVIKKEIIETNKTIRKIIGITKEGKKEYDDSSSDYLDLYSNVLSLQRGSKNHLKKHFIQFKKAQGYTVNTIEKDEGMVETGKLLKEESELAIFEELVKRITDAYVITDYEYRMLRNNKDSLSLISIHHDAMRKYEIESFYRTTADEVLIATDNNGKHREEIRNYTMFKTNDTELSRIDLVEIDVDRHVTDRVQNLNKKRSLKELFSLSGLLDGDGNLLTNKEIHKSELVEAVKYLKKNNVKIQRWFGFDLRGDIDSKPIQQIGVFLRLFGILWGKRSKKRSDGGKDYFYWIPSESIELLEYMIKLRSDNELFSEWKKGKESIKEHRLFCGKYSRIVDEIRKQISDPSFIEDNEFVSNYAGEWD
jgi:hypothetical protein